MATNGFSELRANEMKWIASGLNADDMFTRTYYDDPVASSGEPYLAGVRQFVRSWKWFILIGTIVVVWLVYNRSRRIRTSRPVVTAIQKSAPNTAGP